MRPIVFLSLLAIAACAKGPTGPANTYLVTAFATPASFFAGGTTTVIVGITNVSDTTETFDANFCGPAYHVFDATGTRVGGGGFCASVYIPKTLAPGEQAVYTSQWTTNGADSVGRSTGPLPTGTYTLRGALDGANVVNSPVTVSLVQCPKAFCAATIAR